MGVIQYAKYLPVLTGSGGGVSYLGSDTFTTGSNGDLITARSPEIGTWASQGGEPIRILNGKADAPSSIAAGGFACYTMDAADADVTAEAELFWTGNQNGFGLCVNVQNINNLWMAWVQYAAGRIWIYERSGGGFTAHSFKAVTFGALTSLRLVVTSSGDTVSWVAYDGASVFSSDSFTYTGARPLKTQTKHGLIAYTGDAVETQRYDNWLLS